MSWTDFYQRRDTIDKVLREAGRNPGNGLPFDGLSEVAGHFASKEELALALQYKWSQTLLGRINVALIDAERTADVDQVEAVATAWRTTTAQHPILRELLDGYATEAGEEFLAAVRAEQRMVALAAGLTEYGEPEDEIARVGAAFLALIRRGTQHANAGNPIEQLLRRLVASS